MNRPVGLFDLTGGEFRSDEPPPFWAFAWAGGQALARHLLDHPEIVRSRRVLDLASGSGLVAIAAALAGAAQVRAVDVDPAACAAVLRNAAANRVDVRVAAADAGAAPDPEDTAEPEVVLAGDAFYSPSVAPRMTRALRRAARSGARVLVGDPGRGYLPEHLFSRIAEYPVPVTELLEETSLLVTGVWEIHAT
ncbi:class I SAM-dependent methyltransferase [Krasilnikovia sp. MM14-A1259]|uniref:class I SAM-dependent methyltransferase n=1 Tax=Krasilnikovia sp. MM14-A1259 TaxID=3373539 RepID=UPI00399D14FF